MRSGVGRGERRVSAAGWDWDYGRCAVSADDRDIGTRDVGTECSSVALKTLSRMVSISFVRFEGLELLIGVQAGDQGFDDTLGFVGIADWNGDDAGLLGRVVVAAGE